MIEQGKGVMQTHWLVSKIDGKSSTDRTWGNHKKSSTWTLRGDSLAGSHGSIDSAPTDKRISTPPKESSASAPHSHAPSKTLQNGSSEHAQMSGCPVFHER